MTRSSYPTSPGVAAPQFGNEPSARWLALLTEGVGNTQSKKSQVSFPYQVQNGKLLETLIVPTASLWPPRFLVERMLQSPANFYGVSPVSKYTPDAISIMIFSAKPTEAKDISKILELYEGYQPPYPHGYTSVSVVAAECQRPEIPFNLLAALRWRKCGYLGTPPTPQGETEKNLKLLFRGWVPDAA